MKKLLFILTFFLLVFFVGSKVNATSGTCSWHNGVNCSVGSDADGSVICNDGWRDSSESYYSTTLCNNAVSCTTAQLNQLRSEYNYDFYFDQSNDYIAQLNELNETLNRDFPIENGRVFSGAQRQQYYDLLNQITYLAGLANAANANAESTWNSIQVACERLGEDRLLNMQIEALRREAQAQDQAIQNAQNDTMDNVCAVMPNAYNDNGTCKCINGYSYFASKGTCETPERACLNYFNYTQWSNGQCSCKDGYEFITNNCFKSNVSSDATKETISTQPSAVTSKNEAPKETFIDLKGSTEENIIPAEQTSEVINQNLQAEQPAVIEKKQNPIIKFFQKIFSKIGSWFHRK
jgi:hypothetical protein